MKNNKQLEIWNSIRKDMPPPSKTFKCKKAYDRKDKSWLKDI